MILIRFLTALFATTSSSVDNSNPTSTTAFEVCLSPGCVADGASETLQKMQALAPPGVSVTAGVCCSLCGNGPIVLGQEGKNVVKSRRVSGKKVMDLLLKDHEETIPDSLVEGYDLVSEADVAFKKKDYKQAVVLYESGLQKAFQPALELQAAKDQLHPGNKQSASETPSGLAWLVKARRNEASSKLALGDLDGALFASQSSCNISRNTCPESFEILAEIYKQKGDEADELEALRTMFRLPVNEKNLSQSAANNRRTLKFRLEKLERDATS